MGEGENLILQPKFRTTEIELIVVIEGFGDFFKSIHESFTYPIFLTQA